MATLLQDILTESAARWPDRVALRDQGRELGYRELDRLSNQLARALGSAGVEPGDRVGIYLNKSAASILSIFGILKSGAVFVPLDPNAPAARLSYIVQDCGIRVLVSSSSRSDGISALHQAGSSLDRVILTDPETQPLPVAAIPWTRVRAEEDGPLPTTARATDLAYLLYTSGSTGAPKGVMVTHRNVFTFIDWCATEFRLTPEDRVTSAAPIHFDLSTFDIYVTLQAGATIVLVPEGLSIFPVQVVQLLHDERITATYLVPSQLAMMLTYGQLREFNLGSLRLVLFAGEVFPLKYLREAVAAVPRAAWYNLYGPTETNVVTWYRVQPGDLAPARTEPVPIGRAIDQVEVFAIDEQGNRVTAANVEGELHVRGPCVAPGYWGQPEKSARNFGPGEQYATGDVVTLDPDGINWRFVGRRDHMVKSRGYRIELGEIEAALLRHAEVREAVVVAVPDELVGNRLHAFVVPAGEGTPSAEELRGWCSRQLPSYMVPERIELRSDLPRTSTGKVNRQLLAKAARA